MNNAKILRQKAEELLKKMQLEPSQQLSEVDKQRFMHELEVHQIELEMINEELVKANERAAELATNKYVELYEFAPSGYFTLSKNGAIIGANLFGAKMLGKPRSEIKNSHFTFYVSGDSIANFDDFLDKVFLGKVRETCDVAISKKGNLPIYVQLAGIADQNGKECLVTAVDITDRKLAEKSLLIANQELTFQNEEKANRAAELLIANQELAFQNEEKAKRAAELLIANIELTYQNEEKAKRAAELIIAQKEIAFQAELLVANSYLESLIENANAPIIIWDPQFRITRYNRAFELLTGRKEVEVLGQNLEILFPQKFVANSMALIGKTQTGDKPETIEIEIQHHDGSVRITMWNSATLFEPDGKTPIATIAQGQDITDRKQAEAEMVRQSDLIAMLLDSIPDIIFYKNREGVYQGCNAPFAAFVGKTRDEIVGKTDYDLFDNELADAFRQNDAEMLKQKITRHNDEWITYPDGKKVFLDTLKTPYWSGDGNMIGILGISRDITARNEADKKLKESETKYQLLFENMVEGFSLQEIITDENGCIVDFRILAANAAYEKHTGQKLSDSVGKTIRSVLPYVDTSQIEKYGKVALTGEPLTFEYYSHSYNRHLRVRAFSPKPGQFATTFEDITASKQAEDALKQATARLALATRIGGVGVWDYDLINNQLLWDDQMLRLYGIKKENFFGAYPTWLSALHPDEILRGNEEIRMAVYGEKDFDTEFRVAWPDGTVHHIKALAIVQHDSSGIPIKMIGTNWDITAQKQMEGALQNQARMLKILMDMATTFINIQLGQVGNSIRGYLKEMGEFAEADRSHIFRYDNQNNTLSNVFEWCKKGIAPLFDRMQEVPFGTFPDWVRSHQNGEIVHISDVNDLPDGVPKDYLISVKIKSLLAVPTFYNLQCTGFVGFDSVINCHAFSQESIALLQLFSQILVNVNKRLTAEEEQHETNIQLELAKAKATEMAAKAEAASKAKSSFLANMSHEIRTPLNAIIGFSQLMQYDKLLMGQSKEYASSINRAGEHLLSLINDILELSKAEAGQVVLNPANFDLHNLLNDLNIIFKERAQSKHLSLTFETAPEVPHAVFADEGKLLQIFINLIGNAIKFTDQGGIVVRAKVEQLNGEPNRLIVDIEDTGHGIAGSELGKLFKSFEQTSSGNKQGTGTGLGLALSRELAILMGGDITVTSEPGKGSVFTFQVEVKDGTFDGAKTMSTKRVVGLAQGQKAFQVLVVDDKEDNLTVAVNFLKLAGFETVEATNGKEAIEKFEEYVPDLVLMDLRMHVMNGYEAIQRIRSTEKGRLVPIVAISANLFEDEELKLQSLDIQGYIHKPYKDSMFYGTIGKALGIEYLYEDEIPAPSPEYIYDDDAVAFDLAKLPADLLFKLQEAIEIADSDRVVEILESNFIDNQILAKYLMTRVNNFEWDYLQRILETPDPEVIQHNMS